MSHGNLPPDVASAYNRWAAQYDSDVNTTRDLDAEILRNSGVALAHRRVLEIGCGTGKNTEWLAAQAESLTAMDFAADMLAVARTRVSAAHVRFVQHDVRTPWPLESDSVDSVVGNLVLEHVEHLSGVFAEASRVLAAGGELYLCELHPYRQWRGGQAHFVERGSGQLIHVAAYVHSVSEYLNAAVRAGFSLLAVGEWLEPRADADAPPRLLSMHFRNAAPS